jgi:hypothetical protein
MNKYHPERTCRKDGRTNGWIHVDRDAATPKSKPTTNPPHTHTPTHTHTHTHTQIPADARILRAVAFGVEEAILTGESIAVTKRPEPLPTPDDAAPAPPLGDRKNMAFFGCLASKGRALAVVTATGMGTELGRIARSIGCVGGWV